MVSIPVDDQGMAAACRSPICRRSGVPWNGLLRWLALITVGATAIAVFVANRMVQPLVLLENAVESVGPDAMLPGPAGARTGRGEGDGEGAEFAVVAAEEGDREPHAFARGRAATISARRSRACGSGPSSSRTMRSARSG